MVVEDKGLGPGQQEVGHRGRRAQLVEQDVPRPGPLRVALEVGGLVLELVVGRLHVDVRLPALAAQGVAQFERVVAGGIPREERGDELVDGGHRSRTATRRYSPDPSRSALTASMAALMAPASGFDDRHPVEAPLVAAPGDGGGSEPALGQQVAPGLGVQRPPGSQVADQVRCSRHPRLGRGRVDHQHPVDGQARRGQAHQPVPLVGMEPLDRAAQHHPRQGLVGHHLEVVEHGLGPHVQTPLDGRLDDRLGGVHAVGVDTGGAQGLDQAAVAALGMQHPAGDPGQGGHRGPRPPARTRVDLGHRHWRAARASVAPPPRPRGPPRGRRPRGTCATPPTRT